MRAGAARRAQTAPTATSAAEAPAASAERRAAQAGDILRDIFTRIRAARRALPIIRGEATGRGHAAYRSLAAARAAMPRSATPLAAAADKHRRYAGDSFRRFRARSTPQGREFRPQ